ncbi:MAG: AMP-binding protein [Pseudomonadota bacterium]
MAVTAAEFLTDVRSMVPLLPPSQHILNDCHDRYRFTVALCAILVAGKVSLLPSTRTSETIRQLRKFVPDVACLTDQTQCAIELPQTRYPSAEILSTARTSAVFEVPLIEESQLVAYVFTSGSTGEPVAHRKTWAALVLNVQMEARQLGLAPGSGYTILGTVPAQHMYGFESTVLLPLINGFAMASGESFYPADICASVRQVPQPRMLVTTPVHLRALLASKLALPDIDVILSATAPLAPQLALDAEQTFDAPLLEIYGSTETGQVATRQPVKSPEWVLFPGLRMEEKESRMWISGGHVEIPMPMNDAIELTASGRFLLHGRLADLINIAGKRSSLAHLNHHLNSIPGVDDGAFYMPPEKETGEVTRLEAFVVAPGLETSQIMASLRQKIDAAFLPRPIHKVAILPRNGTGKLPQSALATLSDSLNAAGLGKK